MQYTKKEERLVFSSYFNSRLVSYLILCTHFSFGNDKIVNLEQKTDKYLNDYAAGIYEDGYFESSLLAQGVDVCGFAKRIPARVRLWLTYGDKIPKKLNPKDLTSIRISIQSFFAITVYALCSDFGISAEDINQVYFPNVESTFTCLSDRKRLTINDIAITLAEECSYIDPRYVSVGESVNCKEK